MNILALITARGGSKAVPRKNVLPLAGKPLIAWTIEAARTARSVDRVIVTTDDAEIAEVSREWRADVPFMRPAELAQDNSSSMDAVLHALAWLRENESVRPECVLLLQPTSPLRTAEDIDNAAGLLQDSGADSVIGVVRTHDHPYLVQRMTPEGHLAPYVPTEGVSLRRQDLPPAYRYNGAIYLSKTSLIEERRAFTSPSSVGYVMPAAHSLDIDDPWDFHLADLVLRDRRSRSEEAE